MKKILILVLAMTLAAHVGAVEAPKINDSVMQDMNKPIQVQEKIVTSNWVWIGVFSVVAIVAGSLAYSTKKPI